jgi:FkbM family methyltransferase
MPIVSGSDIGTKGETALFMRSHQRPYVFDPRCPPDSRVSEMFRRLKRKKAVPDLCSADFYPWPPSRFALPESLYILGRRIRRRFHGSLLRTPILLVRVFDYDMYVPSLDKEIGRGLAGYGFRELDQRYVLQLVVKPGCTILDLGSNIGYYVAMFGSLMAKQGRIYAVEPDPRSAAVLRRNVDLNHLGNIVSVDSVAISDYTGIGVLYQAAHPNLSGMALSTLDRHYGGTISVAVHDLGDYLSHLREKVDVLRMDIEGHEASVLRSLCRSLRHGKLLVDPPSTIVFEPHSWEYDTSEMKEIVGELFQYGYKAAFLCTSHEEFSPLLPLGYEPQRVIRSVGYLHGIYQGVRDSDAIKLIACAPGLTTVCLQRQA